MPRPSGLHPQSDEGTQEHNLFFTLMAPPCAIPFMAEKCAHFRDLYKLRSTPTPPDRWHIFLYPIFRGRHLPPRVADLSKIIGGAFRFEQFELKLDMVMSYQNRRAKKPFVVCAQRPSPHITRLARHMGETFSVLSGEPTTRWAKDKSTYYARMGQDDYPAAAHRAYCDTGHENRAYPQPCRTFEI